MSAIMSMANKAIINGARNYLNSKLFKINEPNKAAIYGVAETVVGHVFVKTASETVKLVTSILPNNVGAQGLGYGLASNATLGTIPRAVETVGQTLGPIAILGPTAVIGVSIAAFVAAKTLVNQFYPTAQPLTCKDIIKMSVINFVEHYVLGI